jgi:Domain of unknown function (DUF4872)/Butirosin biosynthesis protein H, N-terminal
VRASASSSEAVSDQVSGAAARPGRMIERFQQIHSPGRDCRLTCARDLLDYFGLRYSHSVVQGLSSAYLFSYVGPEHDAQGLLYPDLDFREYFCAVSGGVMEIFENLAYLFNGRYLVQEQDPSDTALEALRPYLKADLPVLVAVCRDLVYDHLGLQHPPWPAYLGSLKFGGHWMAVVGVDDRRRMVQMFETNQTPPVELPFEVLHAARTAGDGVAHFRMQSRNRWAVFVPSSTPPPLPGLFRTALVKTVHAMTESASARSGASGLRALTAFCRDVPHWADQMSAQRYKASLYMLRLNSVGLSTGAMGRKGFGIFLRRAAALLGIAELESIAFEYAAAADAWQALVGLIDDDVLDERSSSIVAPEPLATAAGAIYEHEQRAFERLARVVERF